MELDKRIIEGKRPLTCYDIEEAKEYIGKVCYVCDEYDFFSKLGLAEKTILKGVEDCEIPFHYDSYDSEKQAEFCIPAEWVKEPEKKYRPYTLAEWIGQHTIGDVIRYRCKSQKIELRHLYVGYGYSIGADIKNTTSGTLTLGVASYTLDYLLEDYEIEVNGEWLPFGVIDEEGAGE